MVNVIWNTIRGAAITAGAVVLYIWNLVTLQWQNNSNNWED
jgi:uncharacterized membrane protein YqjE